MVESTLNVVAGPYSFPMEELLSQLKLEFRKVGYVGWDEISSGKLSFPDPAIYLVDLISVRVPFGTLEEKLSSAKVLAILTDWPGVGIRRPPHWLELVRPVTNERVSNFATEAQRVLDSRREG